MSEHDVFWKLSALSDEQVLDGLRNTVASGWRLSARLVAHLGEVEERRLHLDAACSSMFNYCVTRLGLSEDEACRRIDVARLARRFPAIFPRLATGDLTLSVIALLKSHLSKENANELINAVSGKSVQLAREALAVRFPRPDVSSTVRKLPGPRQSVTEGATLPLPEVKGSSMQTARALQSADQPLSPAAADAARATPAHLTEPQSQPQPRISAAAPRHNSRHTARTSSIEPLAAARYKVQLTAGADLKAKLDLARDLMRHTVPSGDLATIISQALDRLIADLMNQRFGACKKTNQRRATSRSSEPSSSEPSFARSSAVVPCSSQASSAAPSAAVSMEASSAGTRSVVSGSMDSRSAAPSSAPCANHAEAPGHVPTVDIWVRPAAAAGWAPKAHIPRAARRAVVARDGLRCSWSDPEGRRCQERAWLEYDHRHPRAKGGTSEPNNLRLLPCPQP